MKKIREEIKLNKIKSNSYLLYEIVYSADQNMEAKKLFNEIKKVYLKKALKIQLLYLVFPLHQKQEVN